MSMRTFSRSYTTRPTELRTRRIATSYDAGPRPRSPEQLQTENHQLKSTINELRQKMNLQRGKVVKAKALVKEYSKDLSREYSNQLYWAASNTGDSKVLAGVKCHYRQLKADYQKLLQTNEQLRRDQIHSSLEELSVECEILREENSNLVAKLQAEIGEKYLGVKPKQKRFFKDKFFHCVHALKQAEQKIELLEKLLVQRANDVHHIDRDRKRAVGERSQLLARISDLKRDAEQFRASFESNLEGALKRQAFGYEAQIATLKEEVANIKSLNKKLEIEVKYQRQLINHIKPKPQESVQTNENFSVHREASIRTIQRTDSVEAALNKQQHQESGHQLTVLSNPPMVASMASGISPSKSKRPQKLRRIQLSDVGKNAAPIKYRLIGLNVSLDELRSLFSSETGQLTVAQVQGILKAAPFSLSEETALMLARYFIEDNTNEFVYFDPIASQADIRIVQSVVCKFFENYKLPVKLSAETEWASIRSTSRGNLQIALKSVSGKQEEISLVRFTEMLSSLGIQMTEDTLSWCIGQMAVQSEGLDKLKYGVLFR